jgi:phosphate transport system protein
MVATADAYGAAFDDIRKHFRAVFDGGLELLELAKRAVNTREVLPESQLREKEDRQYAEKRSLENAVVRTLVGFVVPPGDVRWIVGVVRSTADLERIGDNAVQIVVAVREANHQDIALPESDLAPLFNEVGRLVVSAVNTLWKDDMEQIDANRKLEDHIDEEYKELTRDLVTRMMSDPTTIPGALVQLNIIRRLERIADHAGNIVEHYISIVKEETG